MWTAFDIVDLTAPSGATAFRALGRKAWPLVRSSVSPPQRLQRPTPSDPSLHRPQLATNSADRSLRSESSMREGVNYSQHYRRGRPPPLVAHRNESSGLDTDSRLIEGTEGKNLNSTYDEVVDLDLRAEI